jgi:hypothetical protein
MDDGADFKILPGDLLRTGLHISEILGRALSNQRQQCAQREPGTDGSGSVKHTLHNVMTILESKDRSMPY